VTSFGVPKIGVFGSTAGATFAIGSTEGASVGAGTSLAAASELGHVANATAPPAMSAMAPALARTASI
jgi:hypothetical protein